MIKSNLNKKSFILFAFICVIGFGLVYSGYNYIRHHAGGDKSYNLPDENVFRGQLHASLNRYNDQLIKAIDSQFSQSEVQTKPTDQAEASVNGIDHLFLNAYDGQSQKEINKLWRDQLTYYIDYAVSVKNQDEEGVKTAQRNLNSFADWTTSFYMSKNATANKEALKKSLENYQKSVISYIDQKNLDAATVSSEDSSFKVSELADKIVDAMYR